MAPPELQALDRYIERVQSTMTDPAERDRALAVVERDLTDALGKVQTYRNDSQLAMGGTGGSDGDGSASENGS